MRAPRHADPADLTRTWALAAFVPSTAICAAMAIAQDPPPEGMRPSDVRRDAIVNETQSLQAELENFKPDTPGFNETARKLTDAAGRLKVFEDFLKRKLEFERAQLVRVTYGAIKSAIGDLSKAQGVDIVFMDDATPPFDKNDPRPITQQISGRRMLWFNPQLDMTDDLIKAMNASFAAGKK